MTAVGAAAVVPPLAGCCSPPTLTPKGLVRVMEARADWTRRLLHCLADRRCCVTWLANCRRHTLSITGVECSLKTSMALALWSYTGVVR